MTKPANNDVPSNGLGRLASMNATTLFGVLLLSRIPILLLFAISDWLIDDYDESTTIVGQLYGFRGAVDAQCGTSITAGATVPSASEIPHRPSDVFMTSVYNSVLGRGQHERRGIREVLRGLRNWDGIHFTHIAHGGYTYEHQCAFFPGMPLVIRATHEVVNIAAGAYLSSHRGSSIDRSSVPAILGDGHYHSQTFKGAVREVCADSTQYEGISTVALLQYTGDVADFVEDLTLVMFTICAFAAAGVCLRALTVLLLKKGGLLHPICCDHFRFNPAEFTGAVVLMYLLTSAGVFTCTLYTEAPFALITLLGLYLRQTISSPTIKAISVSCCFLVGGLFRSNSLLLVAFFLFDAVSALRQFVTRKASILWTVQVVAANAAAVLITILPYVAVNYFAYHHFHEAGPPASLSSSLEWLGFYGYLQRRYWNVGFLTAYTLKNAPNFIVPLPLVIFLSIAVYKWLSSIPLPSGRTATVVLSTMLDAHMVTYGVMLLFAITSMHVQVLVRFLFPSPVTYWLLATLITPSRRTSSVIRTALLTWLVTWILVGTIAFSNHFPWT